MLSISGERGLADLPPFGTFLGKGWITGGASSVAGGAWLTAPR